MSEDPASWGHRTSQVEGAGLTIEVWELARKASRPFCSEAWETTSPQVEVLQMLHAASVPVTYRQVCLRLTGGGVLLKPGAFQHAIGSISAELQKYTSPGGSLARRGTAAANPEHAYAHRLTGHGEVWSEPSDRHFVTMTIERPDDALVLDAQALFACESSVDVGTHVHGSVHGVVPGQGPVQPKLSGRGVLVLECPVPSSEIKIVELEGRDELTVRGGMILAHSASLDVTLRPLVRDMPHAMRTPESLVYTLRGQGKVLLMPTRDLVG